MRLVMVGALLVAIFCLMSCKQDSVVLSSVEDEHIATCKIEK